MAWSTLAAVTAVALFAYQVLIDWVPMYPFNDTIAKSLRERTLEPLLNYAPLLLIAWFWYHPNDRSPLFCTAGCLLYLVGHLNAWWRPYFVGASRKDREEYERLFKRTWKVLPSRGNNPVPDVEHMVLGAQVVALCMLSVIASAEHWQWMR